MESLDTAACFMDDLLNFSSDIGEDEEIEDDDAKTTTSSKSLPAVAANTLIPPFPLLSTRHLKSKGLHYEMEEELEWISNKDAFPMVESLVDILPANRNGLATHQSPISVLENSSSSSSSNYSDRSGGRNASAFATVGANAVAGTPNPSTFVNLSSMIAKAPVQRARSKLDTRKRKDVVTEHWHQWSQENMKNRKQTKFCASVGRKCLHCGSEKTPQWRAGPLGPKTLCNACGVRYKSGRLCDEYRPANSPTFSSVMHSNSHRKIVEMRRQKEMGAPKRVEIG